MTTSLNPSPELKQLLKEAMIEALQEQRLLLHEVVTEALLDIGLGEAVKEGLETEYVSRDDIFQLLTPPVQ
ncbi:MAG: hypothetical protein JNN12_13035 [Bacteroidetes Order II. Incertae sedis bacterium]|nr:hypothetical protein [Bacteroidetes Order II. bacterium]